MIIILPVLGTQLITPFHACCKLLSFFCVLSCYCVWVNLKQTMQSSKLGHSLARVNQFEIGSIHRHRHIMYLHLFLSQWLLPFLTCFRELLDWIETTLFGCNVSAIVISHTYFSGYWRDNVNNHCWDMRQQCGTQSNIWMPQIVCPAVVAEIRRSSLEVCEFWDCCFVWRLNRAIISPTKMW